MPITNGAERLNTSPFSHRANAHNSAGTAVITGGRVGLGFETAKLLLSRGFNVVITGRSPIGVSNAVKELRGQHPSMRVDGFALELGNLDAVRAAVTANQDLLRGWTHLVTNAGAKIESPNKLTAQGFEWHFGVNHLAHHLFTSLLLPLAGAEVPRVTAVASIVARHGQPALWGTTDLTVRTGQLYATSKLANLAWALELPHRVSVTATAAHPGYARAEPYGNSLVRLGEILFAQSAAAGAKSLAAAVTATNGSYLGPRVGGFWGAPAPAKVPSVLRADNQKALWELSNDLTGAVWA